MTSPPTPQSAPQTTAPPRAAMALVLSLLTACAGSASRPDTASHSSAPGTDIVVLTVGQARYAPEAGTPPDAALAAECRAWSLRADDVARFFAASREYPDGTDDAFYFLPCTISGTLQAEGSTWSYQINAAATATWRQGSAYRQFGCTDAACAPLVLLMPDNNAGD